MRRKAGDGVAVKYPEPGNSLASYIPLENYLAMLDEGRRFKLAGGH